MNHKSFVKFLVEEDVQKIKKSIPMQFSNIELPITYKDSNGKIISESYPVKVGNAIQGNMKMGFSFDVTTDCARGCPGCYVDAGRKIGCNAKGQFELLEYRNELSKSGYDKFKEITNKNGGIRMFSGGDYIPSKLANNSTNMQLKKENLTEYNKQQAIQKAKHDFANKEITKFLDDAKNNGWQVKVITKEPEFLDNHIFHDALQTINLSMNKHEFGFSHSEVKNKIKEFGKRGNKIKGRVMAFTPIDIHDIISESDKSHIGVVTSGHNFPGNGILVSPKNPNDREGTKTIFILKNFPEAVKNFLNGEDIPIDIVTKKLNQYTRDYNKTVQDVRNKIEKHLPITVTEYYMLNDPSKSKGVMSNRVKTGEHDSLIFEDNKWHLVHHSPHGISDIKAQKEQQRKEFLKNRKNQSNFDKGITEAKNDADNIHKIKLESDIDLDLKTFDRINPISKEFTSEEILQLAKHLKDKMCCVGGNCYTCTTKCGSKGCEPESNPSIKESLKSFKNFLYIDKKFDNIEYLHF